MRIAELTIDVYLPVGAIDDADHVLPLAGYARTGLAINAITSSTCCANIESVSIGSAAVGSGIVPQQHVVVRARRLVIDDQGAIKAGATCAGGIYIQAENVAVLLESQAANKTNINIFTAAFLEIVGTCELSRNGFVAAVVGRCAIGSA